MTNLALLDAHLDPTQLSDRDYVIWQSLLEDTAPGGAPTSAATVATADTEPPF